MLMLENQKAVSSKDVTDSFGWTSNEVNDCSTNNTAQYTTTLLSPWGSSFGGGKHSKTAIKDA